MNRTRIEYWPPYLQSVFAALAKRTGDRRLSPALTSTLPAGRGEIVAGHRVTVTHLPGKRPGARASHYVIAVAGDQINVCWKLRASELDQLSKSIGRALGRRCESSDGRYELGAEVW